MNNKNNNSWKDIIGEFSANSNVGLYLKGLEHLNTEENQKLYEEKYLPVIQGEKKGKNFSFFEALLSVRRERESRDCAKPCCVCRRRNARTLKYY